MILGKEREYTEVLKLMNEMKINETKNLTYLGIPIDNRLKFDAYNSQVNSSLS